MKNKSEIIRIEKEKEKDIFNAFKILDTVRLKQNKIEMNRRFNYIYKDGENVFVATDGSQLVTINIEEYKELKKFTSGYYEIIKSNAHEIILIESIDKDIRAFPKYKFMLKKNKSIPIKTVKAACAYNTKGKRNYGAEIGIIYSNIKSVININYLSNIIKYLNEDIIIIDQNDRNPVLLEFKIYNIQVSCVIMPIITDSTK